LYGKTCEQKRNRIKVDVCQDEKKFRKLAGSIMYKRHHIITEDLVLVERKKNCIVLDKPIQHGFTILELSKLEMYQFHYRFMLQCYQQSQVSLLYTDTDSLIYSIKTQDIYQDMFDHGEEYDFSNYPEGHLCTTNPYFKSNYKKIGKMKDESKSRTIEEFIGLRAKCYSYTHHNTANSIKKCKGVQKSAIKHQLTHKNYYNCLREYKNINVKFVRIVSKKHQLYNIEQCKQALSGYDDKRFILEDGNKTLAYGHYKLR